MTKTLSAGPMVLETRPTTMAPAPWALLVWMYRASRAVHPRHTSNDLAQRTLLFLGQVLRYRSLRRWHRADASTLHETLAWRPSLVSVVRRPYMTRGWGASRRLAAVEEHYRQLVGRSGALRLGQATVLHLASVSGRADTVEIVLDSPAWFIHEGELCLNLFHEGERIYSLAFSLGLDGGEPVAYVGALQGLGTRGALDRYRALTAACHGLRPRDLLIAAFRIVCRELGLTRWLAVSDAFRVSGSAYFGAAQAVRSSYDAAWSEHRGSARPDGFYRMPVHLARRSHDTVPARKRSTYRRRYEMLDRLDVGLTLSIRARAKP